VWLSLSQLSGNSALVHGITSRSSLPNYIRVVTKYLRSMGKELFMPFGKVGLQIWPEWQTYIIFLGLWYECCWTYVFCYSSLQYIRQILKYMCRVKYEPWAVVLFVSGVMQGTISMPPYKCNLTVLMTCILQCKHWWFMILQVYRSQGRSQRVHLQLWDTAGQER
jgi:hypothetical protein